MNKYIKLMIMSFLLLSMTIPALAEEPKEVNYCKDPATWVEYENLLKNNPTSEDIRVLYALRIGLCEMVKRKELTIDRANIYFEKLRRDLIRNRKEQNKRVIDNRERKT